MNLFSCLEDKIIELELELVESLQYSNEPNLSEAAIKMFLLSEELSDNFNFINNYKLHYNSFIYIQQLYSSKFIEQYGKEPVMFFSKLTNYYS